MIILILEVLVRLVENLKIPFLDKFIQSSEIYLVKFSNYDVKKNAITLNEKYRTRLSYILILSFFVLPVFKNTVLDDFFFWITAVVFCIFVISSSFKESYDKDYEVSNSTWITKNYDFFWLSALVIFPFVFLYFTKLHGSAKEIFLVAYSILFVLIVLVYKYGKSIFWNGVFSLIAVIQKIFQYIARHSKKAIIIIFINILIYMLKFINL